MIRNIRLYYTAVLDILITLYTVPPIRSDFPDYGLIPDFFEEIGPILVQISFYNSDFLSIQLLVHL